MDILIQLLKFADFGGVFILALFLAYQQQQFFLKIDEKMVQILTLLAILTKSTTNFNGVDKVLGNSGEKVAQTIIEAEASHTK